MGVVRVVEVVRYGQGRETGSVAAVNRRSPLCGHPRCEVGGVVRVVGVASSASLLRALGRGTPPRFAVPLLRMLRVLWLLW